MDRGRRTYIQTDRQKMRWKGDTKREIEADRPKRRYGKRERKTAEKRKGKNGVKKERERLVRES